MGGFSVLYHYNLCQFGIWTVGLTKKHFEDVSNNAKPVKTIMQWFSHVCIFKQHKQNKK